MTALPSPPIGLVDTLQRRLDAAGVEGSLGVRVLAAGGRRVRLELPLAPSFTDRSPGAVAALECALAVLCDCGLGLALTEERGDGDGGITLDLRVDQVREVLSGTRHLALAADALHLGEEHGVGRAEVRDDRGRLIAHAAGTMALSPSLPVVARDPAASERPDVDLATLFDGLEVAGASARVPVAPETENTRGIVHGALLVGAALALARAGGHRGRLLSFSAEFLRPVPAEVGELRASIEPVRRGRRFVGDRTSLLLPDGRPAVTVATVFARG